MLKQSLQLRIGQQLTMTPQLQQAIRLLQLSTLELNLEIQQAIETNVMLEDEQQEVQEIATETKETDNTDLEFNQDHANEPPLDNVDDLNIEWNEVYNSFGHDSNTQDFVQQMSESENLHDSLQWQLQLASLNDSEMIIAAMIIDEIDIDGYFTGDLTQASYTDILKPDEIERVLYVIQNFEPLGIGARNLSECLDLQLQHQPPNPERDLARTILNYYMDLLASHDYTGLQRKLKVSKDKLKAAVDLILSLNPRPGQTLSVNPTQYVVPDVFVQKIKGQWQVRLNADATPKLKINTHYANMIKRADNSKDNTYLKDHLQEARWFINSLQSRYDTLLKVANCIVEEQRRFFEYGVEAMRPLVLRDIAEQLEMHESTISRATTHKYMHTPRGVLEFKYFFSSHVGTNDGNGCSSTAIRALIKKLVAAENAAKPLSDNKIATLLSEQGINVARRTVAKYREALAIPASNERKRLL